MASTLSASITSSTPNTQTTTYTLLLNLHYDTTSPNPNDPSPDQEDAMIVIPDTPEVEDEQITAIEITIETPTAAFLEALCSLNPNQIITGITVIDGGGTEFADQSAVEIAPEVWDAHLTVAIWRTERRILESAMEEVFGDADFELAEGDEDHFGDYGDHQALATGQTSERDEYEMI